MKILEHISLTTSAVQQPYARVKHALSVGDFGGAQVKKLKNAPFYRAKLGDAHRLLFKVGSYQGERVILILEVILNHDYKGSRFLRGADINDEDFSGPPVEKVPEADEQLRYVNPSSTTFHLIDKPVSFNPDQEEVFLAPMPLILIGSAGSGKTVLTLEKLRMLRGRVLYISLSAFLVENARRLFSLATKEDEADVDFLSFSELLGMIKIPAGREIRYGDFLGWCSRQSGWAKHHARKLFEEFRGVLSGGGNADGGPLAHEEYRQLGVKQSIFLAEQREQVYELFRRYLAWLPQSSLYDGTILAHTYLSQATPTYDSVVIDEVQDFTVPQLALILKMAKNQHQFILCGDSNQIVHPNFFSWSRVKSFFQSKDDDFGSRIIRILRSNFRNARTITSVANSLLALKQRRFGSIDKESNFLVESISEEPGSITVVNARTAGVVKLNEASRLSTQYAVIVLDDSDKERARNVFDTPLVFSVHEAKGLEYPNVILFSFVSSARAEYSEIVGDIKKDELGGELSFSRQRDKSDKSLEVYKFYINALYVGITRALSTVYIVEEDPGHPLWNLLNISQAAADLSLSAHSSTAEEWSKEAHRLELQGKLEQAQEIRERILKVERVPWSVPTDMELRHTIEQVEDEGVDIHRKRLIELFDLGEAQDLPSLRELVNKRPHAPTKDIGRARELMADKYYGQYLLNNPRGVFLAIRRYGIEHRNQFGETPLLIAAKLWKPRLVEELLKEGANPDMVTYGGLSPLRAVIREIFLRKAINRRQAEDAGATWRLLATPILLNIEGRLVKILPNQGEFILFQTLVTAFSRHVVESSGGALELGTPLAEIAELIRRLPETLIAPHRRAREYSKSLMSKNEVGRHDSTSRKLVVRVTRGNYVLNPLIQMMVPLMEGDAGRDVLSPEGNGNEPSVEFGEQASWRPIYDVLGFRFIPDPSLEFNLGGERRLLADVAKSLAEMARERMQKREESETNGMKQSVNLPPKPRKVASGRH